MRIKGWEVDNFLSIGSCSIDAEQYQGQVVLIEGENLDEESAQSNGAGKSSLFADSIAWCLYGQTLRGTKADAVVHRLVGKDTRVAVDLSIDDTDYRIERYRKHSTEKNRVRIYKNGQDISPGNTRDADALIARQILRVPFSAYQHVVSPGQGLAARFSALTPTARLQLLETLVGSTYLGELERRARENHRAEDANLQLVGREIERLRGALDELTSQTEEAISIDIEELQDHIARLNADKYIKQYVAALLERKHNNVSLQATKTRKLVDGLRADASRLQAELDGAKRKLELYDTNGECPTCSQPLSGTQTSEQIRAECERRIHELDTELASAQAQVRQAERIHGEIETEAREVAQVCARLSAEAESCARQQQQQEAQYQQALAAYTEAERRRTERIRRIEQLHKEITEAQARSKQHETRAYRLQQLAHTLRQVRIALLEEAVEQLSTWSREYMSRLLGSSLQAQVRLVTSTSGNYSIDLTIGEADTWLTLSGGERDRVDLCLLLALQRVAAHTYGLRPSLLLLDEPANYTDQRGVELLIRALCQLVESEYDTVFIATHNPYLKALIPTTIRVIKKDGISYVEQ